MLPPVQCPVQCPVCRLIPGLISSPIFGSISGSISDYFRFTTSSISGSISNPISDSISGSISSSISRCFRFSSRQFGVRRMVLPSPLLNRKSPYLFKKKELDPVRHDSEFHKPGFIDRTVSRSSPTYCSFEFSFEVPVVYPLIFFFDSSLVRSFELFI